MHGQRRSDEHSLQRVAGELWGIDSLQEFRCALLDQLHSLVGCELASYNEIGGSPEETFVVADPAETLELGELNGQLERFGELVVQNPLAAHSLRTGDTHARRMSDFIGQRELHALELYDCIYRHLRVDYQIAFTVPSYGQLIGITLSREACDFDARELALLDGVRRVALPVHGALHERARAAAVLRAVEAQDGGGQAILLVQASGALQPAHARAERLLAALQREAGATQLLRRWMREQRRVCQRGTTPLRLKLGERSLEARYVHCGADALDALNVRVLEEPALPALGELGLTRRQAEVLQRVWKGASNAEIALALSISEHTVRHHLEHIYRRLGVDSRTEAAHAVSKLALAQQPLA